MNGQRKLSPAEVRKVIKAARGSLKRKPGEKPFAEAWAEYKREEIELEESKLCRFSSR